MFCTGMDVAVSPRMFAEKAYAFPFIELEVGRGDQETDGS